MSKVPRLALVFSIPLVIPLAPVKPVATVKPIGVPAIKTQSYTEPKSHVTSPQPLKTQIQTPQARVAPTFATSKSRATVITKTKPVPAWQRPKQERKTYIVAPTQHTPDKMHTAGTVTTAPPVKQPETIRTSAPAGVSSAKESPGTVTSVPVSEGSQKEGVVTSVVVTWEQRFFGRDFSNDAIDGRLNRIERLVYGTIRQGSDQVRFDRLKAALDKKDEGISSPLTDGTPVVSRAHAAFSEESDDCTCEKANAFYEKGDYKNAALYYHKAAVKMAQEWGPNNANVASMKYGEGLCYYNMNQYQNADALYNASLQIYKRAAVINNSDIALAYWALGNSASATQSWTKAISAYNNAVSYYEKLKPSKDYADCLSAFADCYERQGMTQKSRQLIARSREISRRAGSQSYPPKKDTADIG